MTTPTYTSRLETQGRKDFRAQLHRDALVVIGDDNSRRFEPHFRLQCWDEECSLGIRVPQRAGVRPIFDGTAITWTDGDLMVRVYDMAATAQAEKGVFEFEAILGSVPKTDRLVLPIETAGLHFLYQAPLTPADLARGLRRPPNVVGSYAAYHTQQRGLYAGAETAEKYQTGKAFHIFRPEAIDAKGRRCWLDMTLDQLAGTLTIWLNPTWLARASYPVIIDPTFGYTTVGASTNSDATDVVLFNLSTMSVDTTSPATPASSGTLTSISIHISDNGAPGGTFSTALYSDSASTPSARLGVSGSVATPASYAFTPCTVSIAITSGVQYWFAWKSDTLSHSRHVDSGGNQYHRTDGPIAFPNPAAASADGTDLISIYGTYTAAGGGTPTGYMGAISQPTSHFKLSMMPSGVMPGRGL